MIKAVKKNNNKDRYQKLALKLFNRFYHLGLILVALLVLVLGYFWFLGDQFNDFRQSQTQTLTENKQQVEELQRQLTYFQNYSDKSLNFSAAERFLIQKALPVKFDFPSILVQLTSLAQDVGLQVDNVEIKEAKPEQSAAAAETDEQGGEVVVDDGLGFKKVNISLELFGGDYDKLRQLVGALEKSLMLFDVKAIDFDLEEQIYRVDLSTYYYPEQS